MEFTLVNNRGIHFILMKESNVYVEKQAEIEESMSATEKMKVLAKQAGLFGLTVLKQAILSRIAG